jgi:hypothetical protein
MSGIIKSKIFTYQLTGNTLTIIESYGLKQISVFCGTETSGTVTGTRRLGALQSEPIDVEQDETVTIKAIEGDVLTDLTIEAPAGCTLKIVAQ